MKKRLGTILRVGLILASVVIIFLASVSDISIVLRRILIVVALFVFVKSGLDLAIRYCDEKKF